MKEKENKIKKGCFNFRNCCFCCLGIFIAFVIIVVILISLSGLAQVPLLTRLLYGNGPKPSREVAIQSFDMSYFENLFKTAAATNQSQVIVSEDVLSYLINDFVNKENNVLVPEGERTNGSQVVLEDDQAELFLKLRKPKTALTIKIVPIEKEFKAQKFKVGKLRMPVFALNFFFSRFLDFNSIFKTSGIKEMNLEKGRVVITIDPAMFKGDRPEGEAPVPFIPQN